MSVKIEAGKKYVTKDGTVSKPAVFSDNEFYVSRGYPWHLGLAFMYQPNGVAGDGGKPEFDLVREYTDAIPSPVRTKTRKVIDSGVYGRLRVLALDGYHEPRVAVRITSDNNDSAPTAALSAPELRALIPHIEALAEALEEAK